MISSLIDLHWWWCLHSSEQMINLPLLQHIVMLSQPAILIFRLTASQKESIMDNRSSFEIVFASKMMS